MAEYSDDNHPWPLPGAAEGSQGSDALGILAAFSGVGESRAVSSQRMSDFWYKDSTNTSLM